MSIEIVLIPLAIAVTKKVVEEVSEYIDNKQNAHMLLETRMKDETLLKQALEEWSCSFREIETPSELKKVNENEVTFLMNNDGCYTLVLPSSADENDFREWLDNVEKSYTHYLQQRVYLNLVEKAKEQGMVLEDEELLEDNSIQLTYVLNRS